MVRIWQVILCQPAKSWFWCKIQKGMTKTWQNRQKRLEMVMFDGLINNEESHKIQNLDKKRSPKNLSQSWENWSQSLK